MNQVAAMKKKTCSSSSEGRQQNDVMHPSKEGDTRGRSSGSIMTYGNMSIILKCGVKVFFVVKDYVVYLPQWVR
jgi:hypothetical protein